MDLLYIVRIILAGMILFALVTAGIIMDDKNGRR